MVTELNRAALILGQQVTEQLSSFNERLPAQILPVQEQEIEGKHHQPVRSPLDGGSEGSEVGKAVLILNDDLAVDQGRLALELAAGLDHAAVFVTPIVAAT